MQEEVKDFVQEHTAGRRQSPISSLSKLTSLPFHHAFCLLRISARSRSLLPWELCRECAGGSLEYLDSPLDDLCDPR